MAESWIFNEYLSHLSGKGSIARDHLQCILAKDRDREKEYGDEYNRSLEQVHDSDVEVLVFHKLQKNLFILKSLHEVARVELEKAPGRLEESRR